MIHHVSFPEFITATRCAVERIQSGTATQGDVAQVQYVRENKHHLLDRTGYPVTDSQNNEVIGLAAALAEEL